MHAPRNALGLTLGIVALFALSILTAAPALAQGDQPPPPPPAYHGDLIVGGEPAPPSVSVTAYVEGERRGCLTTGQQGAYGGSGGFDPKLVVDGTSEDEGAEVSFEVNGAPATPDEPVAWSSADVRQVNLSASALGDEPLCARTITDGAANVTIEAENTPAGEIVSTELPSLDASETTGTHLQRLDVTAAEDLPELELDVTHTEQAPDGVSPPETEGGQAPLAYVEVDHDLGDGAIEEATLAFHVDADRLEALGLAPGDVVIHHNDGSGWVTLTADLVDETDTGYTFEATTPGFSVFAIGGPAPQDDGSADDGTDTGDQAGEDSGDGDDAGGGGGGGAPSSPAGPGQTVRPGEPFDLEATQGVTVVELPGVFANLTLEVAKGCSGCTLSAEPLERLPADVPPLPEGFLSAELVELQVLDDEGAPVEDAVAEAQLTLQVTREDLPEEATLQQATLLHHDGDGWHLEPTTPQEAGPGGPATHVATVDGFSPFALAVDEEPPRIVDVRPGPGANLSTERPVIGAGFEDNRGIDTSTFTLEIDDEAIDGEDPLLNLSEQGFSYGSSISLAEAETTVRVSIADESGLVTTETWSFSVTDDEPLGEQRQDQPSEASSDGDAGTSSDETGSWLPSAVWQIAALALVGLAGIWWYLKRA